MTGNSDSEGKLADPPDWYRPGSVLRVIGFDHANSPKRKTLVLKSNAVDMRIDPSCSPKGGWIVEYKIWHGDEVWSGGAVLMTERSLRIAFGLRANRDYGEEYIRRGEYICKGRYLNIPGKGDGFSGDPNVSIYVDDDIRGSVTLLLG